MPKISGSLTFIYTHLIYSSELLYSILEEQSIFWNDDLEFIISMMVKTFKKFREEDGSR
jgi:N utilization substance protein B